MLLTNHLCYSWPWSWPTSILTPPFPVSSPSSCFCSCLFHALLLSPILPLSLSPPPPLASSNTTPNTNPQDVIAIGEQAREIPRQENCQQKEQWTDNCAPLVRYTWAVDVHTILQNTSKGRGEGVYFRGLGIQSLSVCWGSTVTMKPPLLTLHLITY